jgi:hypothetical protein
MAGAGSLCDMLKSSWGDDHQAVAASGDLGFHREGGTGKSMATECTFNVVITAWGRLTACAVHLLALLALLALLTAAPVACAQDVEPRAYSNAPIGVNFLVANYADTRGGLPLDPALPVEDEHLETSSVVLAYVHVFALWGNSAKFNVAVPYTDLTGSAVYAGQPLERKIDGLANPAFKLSVNLSGAPALAPKDFADYEQDLIIGASVQVSVPTGQYDDSRVINIGTNRWAIKPEVGISKAFGHWTLEGSAAVTLYTDNTDFYGGNTRAQAPLYAVQGHAIYGFDSGIWASVDATYYAGGRATVDGVLLNDFQQNWRVGATVALPVDRSNSIKLYATSGVWARTGNDFDAVGIAWQYRWGGGF